MLVGGGVINADAEYDAMHYAKSCVSRLSAPDGIRRYQCLPQSVLGMTGLHGHERANNAVKEADLILAVGSRLTIVLPVNAAVIARIKLLSI